VILLPSKKFRIQGSPKDFYFIKAKNKVVVPMDSLWTRPRVNITGISWGIWFCFILYMLLSHWNRDYLVSSRFV